MFRKGATYFCLVLFLVILFTFMSIKKDNVSWKEKYSDVWSTSNFRIDGNALIAQRNNLAKLLNQKQQTVGRMKCEELNRTKVAAHETTDAGGWCPVASKTRHTGFDNNLAEALAEFFQGKYIASFGDGPGKFKEAILETGLVKAYDAYDGAPFCEITSNGLVQFLDLSLPQYGLPVYDWILCLEVAEHIPKEFEEIFLSNIVRHAREGVVLSWARPGQNGYSHVNNQPSEYVFSCMERLGFQPNEHFTNLISGKATKGYLKRNINVFVRKFKQSSDQLAYNA